jgi:hypothetical protein
MNHLQKLGLASFVFLGLGIASGMLPQSTVGWSPQAAVAVALICLGTGLVLALIAFMQSRKGQSLNGPTKFFARAPLALVAIVVLILFFRAMHGRLIGSAPLCCAHGASSRCGLLMKRFLFAAALLLACFAPVFAADVPDTDEIKTVSDKMLLDWNKGMQKGDLSAFYKNDCAKVWQQQTTAEELAANFNKQFGGQKIDFSGAVKEMEPTFEPEPAIAKVGDFDVLTVTGYYDTKPNRFSFKLKLVQEDEEWKLVGINVNAAKPTDD